MSPAANAPTAVETGTKPASAGKPGVIVIGSNSPTPLGPIIFHADDEAVRLTGYSKSDLEGSPLGLVYDHSHLDRLIQKLPTIANQEGFCFMKRDLLRSVEGNIEAYWTIRPVQYRNEKVFAITFSPIGSPGSAPAGGSPPSTGGAEETVTSRARVDEESLRQRGYAPESQPASSPSPTEAQSLSFSTSGVAHDFKNALQNIMMNLEMANLTAEEAGPVAEELKAHLSKAKVSLRQSKKLAEQLFRLARGGSSEVTVFDLGETIREAAHFAAAGSTAGIRLSIHPGLRPIEADKNLIERVIQNLLTNANQAMPKGGTIDLSASSRIIPESGDDHEGFRVPPGNYSVISVRDRGCGISEENLPHIFDPDFSTKKDGWGFGLASCKAAVEAQGGHILVASRRRVGTQFLLFFPWSEKPLPGGTGGGKSSGIDAPSRGTQPAAPPSRILLVEDEKGIAESTARALHHFGHTALVESSGEQALSTFRRHLDSAEPIDMVLLDMSLAGAMQGEDVFEAMQRLDDSIPVVATSGRFGDEGGTAECKLGFSGILAKPFSMNDLKAAIDAALCY